MDISSKISFHFKKNANLSSRNSVEMIYGNRSLNRPKKTQSRALIFEENPSYRHEEEAASDEDLKKLARMMKSTRRVEKLEINCEKYNHSLCLFDDFNLDDDYYY